MSWSPILKEADPLKLYLALNEAGLRGDIGMHARLAVLSARKHTDLRPVLLYIGERNEQTRWFEDHGVEIRDSKLPYIGLIERLTSEGRYWTASVGHWLRTNVCLEETADRHVLYTDVDVVFLSSTSAPRLKPSLFSVAPEFKKDSWNYFNAGVMVANVERMRATYPEFEKYLKRNIEEHCYSFHDQIAYNDFYKGKWDRLPVGMNWKPYWGFNPSAEILHFHGPKLGAISAILDGHWDWDSNHGVQIGSLFLANLQAYEKYIGLALESADGLSAEDHDHIAGIQRAVATFEPAELMAKVDLSFLDHRMYVKRRSQWLSNILSAIT